MIFRKDNIVTVTNSMGVNKTVLSLTEYEKVSSILRSLTGEELLDLQHMVRYPSKKTVIELEKK